MDKGIKILIVEDEIIIAKDIEQILIRNGFIDIRIATNYLKAKQIITETALDLVLCDINLRSIKNGIDLMEEIHEIKIIPFIFITAYNDMDTIKRISKNQTFHYITKPFTEKQLVTTVLFAKTKLEMEKELLTDREKEIVRLLANGLSTKEIAEKLSISFNTVETHRRNMLKKHNCKNTTELVYFAAKNNWLN